MPLQLAELHPEEDETGALWRALSDHTRRRILDLLRGGPRTTGQLAAQFPISRIAVMRHLEVLAEAGLVTSRKRGRERRHYLNLVPLLHVHERWFDSISAGWSESMARLRDLAESSTGTRGVASATAGHEMSDSGLAIDLAFDVPMAATRAAVFDAITGEPEGWWGHPYLRPQTTGLSIEPRLGGAFIEQWPEGGSLLATITGLIDQRFVQLTGPFHLGVALSVAEFELSDSADGVLVQFSFKAIGAIDAEQADRFAGGWRSLVEERLRAYVETGTRLGFTGDKRGHDDRIEEEL